MNTCVHISFPCRGYQQCSHGSMGHQMSTIRDQGYRAARQGTGGYADAGRGRKTQESSGPRVRRSVFAIFHTVINGIGSVVLKGNQFWLGISNLLFLSICVFPSVCPFQVKTHYTFIIFGHQKSPSSTALLES